MDSGEDDCCSEILAGNLGHTADDEWSSDTFVEESDYEGDDTSFDNGLESEFYHNDLSLNEIKLADGILENTYGCGKILTSFIRLLITGKIAEKDILVQALCYKVQSVSKGNHSVRYLESYGMFWAGVRNLIKSRGLVVFHEHFPIPSKLGKYRSRIIQLCGLDKSLLGKSGLQKSNLTNWIKQKLIESKGTKIPVSLAIDAKKIAATVKGKEDLGGLANSANASDEELAFKEKIKTVLDLLLSLHDRGKCFVLYDILTEETSKLLLKLSKIDELLQKNKKGAEKNSNLLKYVHVLSEQKVRGTCLIDTLHELQRDLISIISKMRNFIVAIPSRDENLVNLRAQENYRQLSSESSAELEDEIKAVLENYEDIYYIPWHEFSNILPLLENSRRGSLAFQLGYKSCCMKDTLVYQACGLDQKRPLADMKAAYSEAHSSSSELPTIDRPDQSIIATVVANFAPVTFGRNRIIQEGGLYVKEGVCSSPDLLVYENFYSKGSFFFKCVYFLVFISKF